MKKYIVLAILPLFFIGCSGGGVQMEKEQHEREAVPVVVDTVKQQDVQLYIRTTGETRASMFIEIPARVTGVLKEMFVPAGAIVQQGMPLFQIDPSEFQTALDAAKAQLALDKTSEDLAMANLDRGKNLISSNAISEQEYQTLNAEHQRALATTRRSQAALEKAEIDFGYTKIYSPITGKASWNLVDIGNLVGPQSSNTKLLTIAQMDPIHVYFDISDADLNSFLLGQKQGGQSFFHRFNDIKSVQNTPEPRKPAYVTASYSNETSSQGEESGAAPDQIDGQPFYISLLGTKSQSSESGYEFEGKITLIDNRIRNTTGQITLRGEISNSDYRIFPGQVCRVRIPSEKIKNATIIREEAILTDLDTKYIFVVNPENKIERRTLKLGKLENGMRIVTEGLKGDETYVVQGTQKIGIGATVAPTPITQ